MKNKFLNLKYKKLQKNKLINIKRGKLKCLIKILLLHFFTYIKNFNYFYSFLYNFLFYSYLILLF